VHGWERGRTQLLQVREALIHAPAELGPLRELVLRARLLQLLLRAEDVGLERALARDLRAHEHARVARIRLPGPFSADAEGEVGTRTRSRRTDEPIHETASVKRTSRKMLRIRSMLGDVEVQARKCGGACRACG
jgi:hypothetical protein